MARETTFLTDVALGGLTIGGVALVWFFWWLIIPAWAIGWILRKMA